MKNSTKKLKIMFNAGLKCGTLHPDDNSYDNIHFEQAVERCGRLKDDLLQDKGLWEAWKANIAMAFKDEAHRYKKNNKKKVLSQKDIHLISNSAADYFLNLLLK